MQQRADVEPLIPGPGSKREHLEDRRMYVEKARGSTSDRAFNYQIAIFVVAYLSIRCRGLEYGPTKMMVVVVLVNGTLRLLPGQPGFLSLAHSASRYYFQGGALMNSICDTVISWIVGPH